MRALHVAAVTTGGLYLAALGWAMQNLSYDVWGAFVVVPVLAVVSAPLINRAVSGDLEFLRPWVWLGLFVKFAGGIVGYNIRFDAYGGSADAGRYHQFGKVLAEEVRSGLETPFALIPRTTGTEFVEVFTGAVYTIVGSSRLGGFMVFTWLSFWGLVFLVKAAHHAIPGLATRRYALAVLLFPSLIYWGSSIGKEAMVGFCLGLTSWGAALVLTRRGEVGFGMALTGLGLAGATFVRPHFGAIWAGAVVIALAARAVLDLAGRCDADVKRRVKVATIMLVVVAGIGFVMIASTTLDFLPSDAGDDSDVGGQLSSIFETAEHRTTQGGSAFTPMNVTGPHDWPWAAFRTITRPFLHEANGLGALLPAVEMTALLVVGIFSWRRLANAPRLMLSVPYIVFAALCVLTFGVAFSSIGNLGILARQRSLILPLVLLFWCLPPIVSASERRAAADAESEPATHGNTPRISRPGPGPNSDRQSARGAASSGR